MWRCFKIVWKLKTELNFKKFEIRFLPFYCHWHSMQNKKLPVVSYLWKKLEILNFQCVVTCSRSICICFTLSQNMNIFYFFFLYMLSSVVITIINLDQEGVFSYIDTTAYLCYSNTLLNSVVRDFFCVGVCYIFVRNVLGERINFLE